MEVIYPGINSTTVKHPHQRTVGKLSNRNMLALGSFVYERINETNLASAFSFCNAFLHTVSI